MLTVLAFGMQVLWFGAAYLKVGGEGISSVLLLDSKIPKPSPPPHLQLLPSDFHPCHPFSFLVGKLRLTELKGHGQGVPNVEAARGRQRQKVPTRTEQASSHLLLSVTHKVGKVIPIQQMRMWRLSEVVTSPESYASAPLAPTELLRLGGPVIQQGVCGCPRGLTP